MTGLNFRPRARLRALERPGNIAAGGPAGVVLPLPAEDFRENWMDLPIFVTPSATFTKVGRPFASGESRLNAHSMSSLSSSMICEAFEVQGDDGDVDHCAAGIDQQVDFLRQTAIASEPTEAGLDDPMPQRQMGLLGVSWSPGDLEAKPFPGSGAGGRDTPIRSAEEDQPWEPLVNTTSDESQAGSLPDAISKRGQGERQVEIAGEQVASVAENPPLVEFRRLGTSLGAAPHR